MTYFSVNIAVILKERKEEERNSLWLYTVDCISNYLSFFLFVIFFYLNHTALNVSPQYAIPLPQTLKLQKVSVLRFRASRAINLDCFIRKRWFTGFIKNQHKNGKQNFTSCADPSCLSMKEQHVEQHICARGYILF